MFCPNCGTGNDDGATKCQHCGFSLKPSEGPKFKGTMMMMNAPEAQEALRKAGVQVPGSFPTDTTTPSSGGTQPSLGQIPEAAPDPQAPVVEPAVKPKLKGTMIGVAPPALGLQMDSPAGAAKPSSIPPAGGSGVAATVAQPAAVPDPAASGSAQSRGTAATMPQAAAPVPPLASAPHQPARVNPLGGTVVAPAEQFQQPPAAGAALPSGGSTPAPTTRWPMR